MRRFFILLIYLSIYCPQPRAVNRQWDTKINTSKIKKITTKTSNISVENISIKLHITSIQILNLLKIINKHIKVEIQNSHKETVNIQNSPSAKYMQLQARHTSREAKRVKQN